MARRLFGAKTSPEPMLTYYQLDHWEQISVKSESECKIFILENTFYNVASEMAAIFSKVWWVNSLRPSDAYMRH